MKAKNGKMTYVQRAVWRKRGSNSPESLCGFGSFAPRPSGSGSPACAKPPPRYTRIAEYIINNPKIWETDMFYIK